MAPPILDYVSSTAHHPWPRFAAAARNRGILSLALFASMVLMPISMPEPLGQFVMILILGVAGTVVTSLGIYYAIRSFLAGEQIRRAISGLVLASLLWPLYLFIAYAKAMQLLDAVKTGGPWWSPHRR